MPILPGTDGERRMSKSLGNYIGVSEPPAEIYGKTLSIPDSVVPLYCDLLLGQAVPEDLGPRDAKRALARALVEQFYNLEAAQAAERDFDRVHRDREIPAVIDEVHWPVAELGDTIHLPELIRRATEACERLVPGIRCAPFGHLGDGNIHFNVSQPVDADRQAFLDRWDAMNEIVHGIVARLGGSYSAEHGVGQLKRGLLARWKDPASLAVMRQIKAALDPNGVMNPGKVL